MSEFDPSEPHGKTLDPGFWDALREHNGPEQNGIVWKQECPHGGVKYPENFNDYADPLGDHSYELWVAAMNKTGLEPCDKWSWEVSWPEGQASGETKTREEARAWAAKIYLAVAS
jgi:hypothetical protein